MIACHKQRYVIFQTHFVGVCSFPCVCVCVHKIIFILNSGDIEYTRAPDCLTWSCVLKFDAQYCKGFKSTGSNLKIIAVKVWVVKEDKSKVCAGSTEPFYFVLDHKTKKVCWCYNNVGNILV
jgi:hypothetical protein